MVYNATNEAIRFRHGSIKMRIEIATSKDLPEILSVVNSAFVVETFIEGTRTDAAQLGALLQKGEFLLVREGETIVASIYTELRGDRGYFGMLAVDPSQQGRGLGRTMVAAAEEKFRASGCHHVDISVLSPRLELFPFYRKLGYSETGISKDYPSPDKLKPGVVCKEIWMSKELGQTQ